MSGTFKSVVLFTSLFVVIFYTWQCLTLVVWFNEHAANTTILHRLLKSSHSTHIAICCCMDSIHIHGSVNLDFLTHKTPAHHLEPSSIGVADQICFFQTLPWWFYSLSLFATNCWQNIGTRWSQWYPMFNFQHKTVFRVLGTCYSIFEHILAKRWRNTISHQKLVLLYLASLLLSTSFAPEPNPSPVNDGSQAAPKLLASSSDHHTLSSPSSPHNCGTCNISVSWREGAVACNNSGQWFDADCFICWPL